ncbi:MAG TPA: DUF1501 domain-containing protein [Armatimonadota bacterium]|nr:DUF1501 domain-containing protein [Armatimonadota bacterium]
MRPNVDETASHACRGPVMARSGRREILRFGLAGLAGLGLGDLLGAQSASAAGVAGRKDTAVILVWCHGGPSHLETYDPKPDAPAEYRGPFGAIPTNVAGVRISELLPRQAKVADRFSLIRSVLHRGICHQQGLQTLLTGKEELVLKQKPDHPDAFCVLAKMRERPGDALPVHVGIPPLPYGGAAYLGAAYEPFVVSGDPNSPTFEVPNVRLKDGAERQRLERRVRLMHSIDGARRMLEDDPLAAARDRHYEAAVDLLTSGKAREAFDLSREATALRDRYGRTRWGQSLLLARRLVEAGVGAVVVSLLGVENGIIGSWDDHAVNADCFKAMQQRAPIFDQAVSALIQDVYDRGLDRRVLILVTGEFGRTPKISHAEGRPGRDHWPHAMSILVSGGGLRMGQVIGATDARGEFVEERPLSPNDLLATLYRHLGVDPSLELTDRSGRPVRILDRTEGIRELG